MNNLPLSLLRNVVAAVASQVPGQPPTLVPFTCGVCGAADAQYGRGGSWFCSPCWCKGEQWRTRA